LANTLPKSPRRFNLAGTADALARQHIANALVEGSARFDWTVVRREALKSQLKSF